MDHPTPAASRPRGRRRWWLRIAAVLVLALASDYALYPRIARPAAGAFNRGENGLWLRYTWYFGRRTGVETHLLADHLVRQQVRYAYFHVRHVTRDGSLRYHHPGPARRLNAVLKRRAPQVRSIAWIYAGNVRRAPGLREVDLSRPEVRARMASEAAWLVRGCGFDGVQWDYEVCANGDPHFLSLLRETRAALPRTSRGERALLGVATPMWLPAALRHWGWSDGYFRAVARECDQIAVMCYDSGAYLPRGYAALVAEQARRVPAAVASANPDCRVLLGLPTYARGGPSHHAHSENLRVALLGVRQGLLSESNRAPAFAGVALFADYTTQPGEWETYHDLWLAGKARPAP